MGVQVVNVNVFNFAIHVPSTPIIARRSLWIYNGYERADIQGSNPVAGPGGLYSPVYMGPLF